MRRLIPVVIVAFVIGALGAVMLLLVGRPLQPRNEVSGTALVGGPFTLTDQNGNTVSDTNFRGRYMLVYFGYTHCPDVCPAELQVMASAMDNLGDKAKKVVPVFITVDPIRDTPGVLKAYLKNFGSEFVGLTGTEKQIADVAAEYRVVYSIKGKNENLENYTVDHTTILYLMGPDGKYLNHFNFGVGSAKIDTTLKRYL
jgi:protein SCO1